MRAKTLRWEGGPETDEVVWTPCGNLSWHNNWKEQLCSWCAFRRTSNNEFICHILAQALVLHSVTVRLLDGNDVSGPLISNSFNFFLPVVKNSHGTAALLKKLTLQKLFEANQKSRPPFRPYYPFKAVLAALQAINKCSHRLLAVT